MRAIATRMEILLWIVLAVVSMASAKASTYSVRIDTPLLVSDPIEAFPLAPLDLGTRVRTVERVDVALSGVHSNGWWVGDGIEDYYVGPLGASLDVYLYTGADIDIPDLIPEGWYEGRIVFTNDGVFSVQTTLRPSSRYFGAPIPTSGRVALCCINWPQGGFGTFTRYPHLRLDLAEVNIEADPILEIISAQPDGALSWSALPPGGVVEVLTAGGPSGPWTTDRVLPSESRSVVLHPPGDAAQRFYQLRWRNSASP